MSPYRRTPRPLSLALELSRADWEPQTLLGEIQAAWSGVVGAAIASESTPAREQGGVLTVGCSSSVWAQELELMGPSIVERLTAVLSGGSVTRLRCVATRG